MNLGLDFDDTYTRDPIAWDMFIQLMQSRGHSVFLVTWRTPEETEPDIELLREKLNGGVYFTSRKAKQKFMYAQGIDINVWLDDNPWAITHTMEGWE